MKLINTRSLVAALGLSFAAQGAWAQPATSAIAPTAPLATQATTPSAPPSPQATMPAMPPAAAPARAHSHAHAQAHANAGASHQGPHGNMGMGQDHQAIIDKLGLSPEQKAQYDAAKTARTEMRKAKQASMAARQKAMTEQLSKDQMDPRAMIELNKQSRAGMEAKRIAAEQKWLAFWDGLNAEQRKTFTAYMKSKQENHAQKHQGSPRS